MQLWPNVLFKKNIAYEEELFELDYNA